ncbi:hypothetical protein BJ741DRAFT_626693 [Chytriomyces cf. hyalinus JEL632]|nr:hypothetical protein BJ741DRAFT_626693 [Chytriomyces cf. hyalinus JEL632]
MTFKTFAERLLSHASACCFLLAAQVFLGALTCLLKRIVQASNALFVLVGSHGSSIAASTSYLSSALVPARPGQLHRHLHRHSLRSRHPSHCHWSTPLFGSH